MAELFTFVLTIYSTHPNTDTDGLESDNDGRVLTLDNISAPDSNRAQGTYNSITSQVDQELD